MHSLFPAKNGAILRETRKASEAYWKKIRVASLTMDRVGRRKRRDVELSLRGALGLRLPMDVANLFNQI